MRYPDNFLDEIRSRLPASDVVGRHVKLRKQGREFAGLSPFNAEKTPSFFVNDDKARWFDFSAGKSGDIFTFLMETEGLSFPEAVERLAGEAGVPMPARDPQAEARERKRASLHDVMELAAGFFVGQLQSSAGAQACGYLQRRGITPELQARFRIGYAPNSRNAVKEHLAGKGVELQQMIDAGLLIAGEDIPVAYDRFRDRVMFPINDLRGRVVAFGGRALSADAPAKYLNSPETELFHKGGLLFNAAAARRAAHDAGTVIVVEGYADVVQMTAAGLDHAVAPLGTALTDRQLEILWRMAPEPILCFDGDTAGRRAAHKALDTALPKVEPGRSLRFALLPGGQDPDDLIRAEGRGAMDAVLDAAVPMIDLLWTRETEGETFSTPERKASLERRFGEIVRTIGDEAVRRHYQQALRDRLAAYFGYGEQQQRAPDRRDGARREWSGRDRNPRGRPSGSSGRGERLPVSPRLKGSPLVRGRQAYALRDAVLLMTVVHHPDLLADALDAFSEVEFTHRDLDALRAVILDLVSQDEAPDAAALRRQVAESPTGPVAAALDRHLEAAGFWPARAEAAFADAAAAWRQALALHLRNRTLNRDLREAEAALARDPSDLNLARLVDIQKQLASQDGIEALIEGFGAGSGRSAAVF